jgi:hypothetical protein
VVINSDRLSHLSLPQWVLYIADVLRTKMLPFSVTDVLAYSSGESV